MLSAIRHIIVGIIDFFHKPFSRWIGKQNFRYLACGGSNAVLDILVYFVSYNYILQKQPVPVGDMLISSHVAALIIAFCTSTPVGFILSRYIVFPESQLRGRVQLFRYYVLVFMCILLNYVFIKLFVEVWHIYPTPSKVLTTALVAVFSYIAQRRFTFKVKPITIEIEPEPVAVNNESVSS